MSNELFLEVINSKYRRPEELRNIFYNFYWIEFIKGLFIYEFY